MSILWGGICKSFLEVITTKGIYSELQSSTILEEKFMGLGARGEGDDRG